MAAELGHLAQAAAAMLCLLIFHAQARASGGTGTCISGERDALLSFKAGLVDPAGRLSSWHDEDCCQWKGVRCHKTTGHVVKLDLRNVKYDSLSLSRDEMSSSLAALQQLRYLDLSRNDFNGTSIPAFIGSLENLRYLNLSSSAFGGRIPSQLGNLSNLKYLDVGDSYGDLHTVDLAWLSHLSLLSYLDLSRVPLHAVRNWFDMVNMLSSLKVLRLANCGLTSPVSTTSKTNLTHLEVLDLSSNTFSTSLEHSWFWDITSLKEIYLSSCYWHGCIPREMGNMKSLQVIDVSDNDLVGFTPDNLENLCNLKVLRFDGNNINMSIGEFMDRLPSCSWSTIQVLSMDNTNMTGKLPIWIGNMTSLSVLIASRNMIVGTVPLGFGALGNLTLLDLRDNNLHGVLMKKHFSGLLNIESLALQHNSFQMDIEPNWVPPFRLKYINLNSCPVGPHFPVCLRRQTDIDFLDLRNTNLDDVIPDWFWVTFSQASSLYASGNMLRGSLPESLHHISVGTIDLGSNKLTGLIPLLPVNISWLNLSSNSFSGSLPSVLQLAWLEVLLLADNQITGTIPSSMCQLTNMIQLDLSGNKLTDVMQCWKESDSNNNLSTEFGSNLASLFLSNNNISGEFPKFLHSASRLEFLDLSYNRFFGTLPKWLPEKLPLLQILRLRSNMFSGHIPKNLTCLEGLHYLDMAHNNISGTIPRSLSKLKAMRVISTYNYGFYFHDSMSVTTKDETCDYNSRIYRLLVDVDLSCNSLTGQIPEEISLLIGINSLNLSSNQLIGNIPNQIGDLKQLESLDLSCNELSGEIPSGLSALTSLSYLNLSYNNLSGVIPSGPQLQVLDNQIGIYIGNPGLCRYPLPKSCFASTDDAKPSVHHEDVDHISYLYLGMGIGFVVGLWVVFCTILFGRTWAIPYFQVIDKLYDEVYVWLAIAWARLTKNTRDDAA